jgi:hypothetical protein
MLSTKSLEEERSGTSKTTKEAARKAVGAQGGGRTGTCGREAIVMAGPYSKKRVCQSGVGSDY